MTKGGSPPRRSHRPPIRTFPGLLPGLLLGLLLGPLLPAPATAQGWIADLYAGRASFETTPTASASTNAALGFRHRVDHRLVQVGFALPLGSDDLFWAMGALGDRLARRTGRVELGIDLMAQGHLFREPTDDLSGRELRAGVLPVASISVGPTVLEGRSGGAWYRGRWEDDPWSRGFWATELEATAHPHPRYRLSGEARHLRGEGSAFTFLGIAAQAAIDRVHVFGSVGEWVEGLAPELPSSSWALGASTPVRPGVSIWASARRESFDPLYLTTAPRTSWSAGVSVRIGSDRSRPSPVGPEVRESGRVVLRLPLSEASSPPFVAGDFTDWEPVPMHRHGGQWRLEIALSPGVYHYAFRSSDGEWFVPDTIPGRRDDGMGGWVAVLVIPTQ